MIKQIAIIASTLILISEAFTNKLDFTHVFFCNDEKRIKKKTQQQAQQAQKRQLRQLRQLRQEQRITNPFIFSYDHIQRPSSFSSLAATVSPDVGEEMLPGIQVIDETNDKLESLLTSLRNEFFFRLYSVDILGSCEYFPQELLECYSESCEIYPVDEDEVRINLNA